MDKKLALMGGVGLGAGLMFLLDPTGGRRRRAPVPERHDEPSDVPALQGDGSDDEPGRGHWSPAARLLAGAAGGGLAVYGLKRRDALGAAVGSLGLGLFIGGLADTRLRRMLRLGDEGTI